MCYLSMEGVLPSACGQSAPLRGLLYAALFHAELVKQSSQSDPVPESRVLLANSPLVGVRATYDCNEHKEVVESESLHD